LRYPELRQDLIDVRIGSNVEIHDQSMSPLLALIEYM